MTDPSAADRAAARPPDGAVPPPGEQLALLRTTVRGARAAARSGAPARGAGAAEAETSGTARAVARVAVDVPLAHLDRFFDYRVPAAMEDKAMAGVRVRVRFNGQLVDGYVLERADNSDYRGRLLPLQRVVSPEPVLAPEIAHLARLVADRYAGTLADVLRLAVPPRHARVEAQPSPAPLPPPPSPSPGTWVRYETGPAYLAALTRGDSPRAVWTALPGPHWPAEIALAVQAALAAGRGALVVVPSSREVDRVDAALAAALEGGGRHLALTAELGPAERYRRWLAVRRGSVRAVVGTRAAMFAPVADLGLVVVWDDGDDLHSEPRSPYPHAREVLALRAHEAQAGTLIGGFGCTAESAALIAAGWARPLSAGREAVRQAAPRVHVAGSDEDVARDEAARSARLPSSAWKAAREALNSGPVLVQVPRRGYLPSLSCERCREPAHCTHCAGPLEVASGDAVAQCRWCGRPAGTWHCPACGGGRLRAHAVGMQRTAEELGRAFPSVTVRTSGRDAVLTTVSDTPALVVATPGAEPVAEGGYAAALLLDGWTLLARPDLRTGEEALRRWLSAAALVRPASEGGIVVLMAEAALTPVQALVRWDPVTFAERELAERAALGFPPATRLATVVGDPEEVRDLLDTLHIPEHAQVLGPVPIPGTPGPAVPLQRDATAPGGRAGPPDPAVRVLIRVPRTEGTALAAALQAAQRVRSARKTGDRVRIRIDPVELG